MRILLEWWMALRFLSARRSEKFISIIAWFSLLGIVLGVAALIIVTSVMNGFRHEIFAKMLDISGHITLRHIHDEPIKNWQNLKIKYETFNDIIAIAPMVEGQALLSANGLAYGLLVRGNFVDDLRKRDAISNTLTDFNENVFKDGRGILISHKLADRMNVKPGDTVTLIAPQGAKTAFGIVPRLKDFFIAGLFTSGTFQIDQGLVFLHPNIANAFFNRPEGAIDGFEITLKNPYKDREFIRDHITQINHKLRIISWRDLNQSLANALDVERNVMFVILTLIIIVASFNIITGQVMLVRDKVKTIAILMAMGFNQGSILRIFLLSGALIGIIGTALGTLLGLVFTRNIEAIRRFLENISGSNLFNEEIYFLSQLPSKTNPNEIIMIIIIALLLSLLAAFYPAWKAARLHPVQGLHHG